MAGSAFAGSPPTCNGLGAGEAAQGFKSGADPAEPTNARFFSSNASGSIYEYNVALFPTMPEVGEPPLGQVIR
jgi:hypothetical protein